MSSNIILTETGYYRSACVECQRRKQKCNREWPCDSCRRRKVPDGCRYNEAPLPGDAVNEASAEKAAGFPEKSSNRASLNVGDGQVLEALAERAFVNLGLESSTPSEDAPPEQKQDLVKLGSSAQLDHLIKLLPQRQLMDDLIQLFVNDINFHYYIIYSPVFLQDYHIWWERRTQDRPVSLQYTCLLAMLCSCTIQHVSGAHEEAVLAEYGESIAPISDKLHAAVRELSGVIPVGHYHMMNVQRLLHSCYWYKAEARFVEAWHVLNQAILEAKELELHVEPKPDAVSDFEREMRRRLWCMLDTWDWQISSGLSRPKLIDRGGCTAELPDLTLEGYNPSPMEHMKMQSQLTRELAARFGAPKNIISTQEVQDYKGIILAWVERFPKIYSFYTPDMSRDAIHPWIVPHRFYLYTMACLLILNPIRHYMVKSCTNDMPADELQCRSDGLYFSLILIKTQQKWVSKINGRDGRLHFIIFSIFDTAAILCTALVKDQANTIENKEEVLQAIAQSTAMLKALINISETAKMSHDILYRLTKKLKKPSMSKESGDGGRKRSKLAPVAPSQSQSVSAAGSAKASQPSVASKSDRVSPEGQLPKGPPAPAQVAVATTSYISQQQPKANAYAEAPPPATRTVPQTMPSAAAHSMAYPVQQVHPNDAAQQQAMQQTSTHRVTQQPLQHVAPHYVAQPQYAQQNSAPQTAPPPQCTQQSSASRTTHPQYIQQTNAPQAAQPPYVQQSATHTAQPPYLQQTSAPQTAQPQLAHMPQQHAAQMPMGMGHPNYFQPMQPGMHLPVDPNQPSMTQTGSRTSPTMQQVGYPPEQPPPLGSGTFNMNVANGLPAIANHWDGPATPLTPVISYNIMGQDVPVNFVPQPRDLLMGHQQEHIVPDLNLSNLTEAEIGGLAPLWGWHSSNLFPEAANDGATG